MKKILGILGLLIFICLVTGLLNPRGTLGEWNIGNVVRRSSPFAILSIGVAFVIITGGIDLSIGSVVALVGVLLPWFLVHERMSVANSIIGVITISLAIGLFHGLLITKSRLQPFIVTLCGLMIYRGVARGITGDSAPGFGNRFEGLKYLASGAPFQMTWLIAAVGVIVIIWACWPHRDLQRQSALPRAVLASIGIILTLVGTAPLWWFIKPDTTSIDPDTFAQMSFFRRGLVEIKASEPPYIPQLLFFWIGLFLFSATSLWFIIRSLLAGGKALIPSLAALICLILAFFISRSAINDWPEALDAPVHLPKLWIILRLSAGLGIAAAGLIWFTSTALRAIGHSLHTPLFLAIAGGVMCLLGFTPLPQLNVPMPFLIMLGLAIIAAIFLNNTIWGRYLLALGRNEQAARYSGVNTHNMIILSYVICSLLACFGGIIFVLDVNSAQPSDFGDAYELYAIAAAVLGGCSLRGGEGTIAGVIIGAAVIQTLRNSINLLFFPSHIEFAIIGTVLLIGVLVDEYAKRLAAHRRATL